MIKIQNKAMLTHSFENLNLVFCICFGFRYSDLGFSRPEGEVAAKDRLPTV